MIRRDRNVRVISKDIDYDKLAEAIVKANKKAEEEAELDTVQSVKKNFFKIVWGIIRDKNDTKGRFLTHTVSVIVESTFFVLYIILLIAAIISLVLFFISIFDFVKQTNLENFRFILLFYGFTVICFMYSLIMKAISNDVKREKDRNYIMAIFSALLAFGSFVYTWCSFYKG